MAGSRAGHPGPAPALTRRRADRDPSGSVQFSGSPSPAEKIRAQWNGKAIPGQQPAVIFEIRRDGRLNAVGIDKSSGNAYYDQVALRAINDAGPFPPLPEEFKKPMLRIGLQFLFDPQGG